MDIAGTRTGPAGSQGQTRAAGDSGVSVVDLTGPRRVAGL
jgi:hypothetical protein